MIANDINVWTNLNNNQVVVHLQTESGQTMMIQLSRTDAAELALAIKKAAEGKK